ncbi:MAG: hypothetical protein WDZ31_08165 [Phycisphaeraceae bacterium]
MLCLALAGLLGCSRIGTPTEPTFSGTFYFRNHSDSKLTQVTVSGFDRNSGFDQNGSIGNLVVNSRTTAVMHEQRIPAEARLTWVDPEGDYHVATLPVPPLPTVNGSPASGTDYGLLFIFEADMTWSIHWEPKPTPP